MAGKKPAAGVHLKLAVNLTDAVFTPFCRHVGYTIKHQHIRQGKSRMPTPIKLTVAALQQLSFGEDGFTG
jgi:hypothetical protein